MAASKRAAGAGFLPLADRDAADEDEDATETEKQEEKGAEDDKDVEEASLRPGWLSTLLFLWVNPIAAKGQSMQQDDMAPLYHADKARVCSGAFMDAVHREMQRPKPSVLRAFVQTFWWKYALIGLLRVLRQGLQVVNSVVFLPVLLTYIQTPAEERAIGEAIGLIVFIGCSFIVQSLCHHHYFQLSGRMGLQFRSSFLTALFSKTLRMRAQGIPSGVIVNMVSNDGQRLLDGALNLHNVFISPLEVLVLVSLLIAELGLAAIPGVAIIILFFPMQGFVGRIVAKTRAKSLQKTDARVRLMTDILQSMKLVKLYGWQKPLAETVDESRSVELQQLRKIAHLKVVNMIGGISTPVFACVASFCVYAALGNILTPQKAFAALALFNMLRLPLSTFPSGVKSAAESYVGMQRLQMLLSMPDMDVQQTDEGAPKGVHLKGATFKWAPPSDTSMFTKVTASTSPWVLFQHACQRFARSVRACWLQLRSSRQFILLANDADASTDLEQAASLPALTALTASAPPQMTQASHSDINLLAANKAFQLKNIDLDVRSGQLVALVGAVGYGKSSLLSAMLSEMVLVGGEFKTRGRIAFVPQQSWIANATLRDNVLFGMPLDEAKYDAVIRSCCLDRDIADLPGGDLTEIGERGVNLSGGQRSRVSLARAVYSDSDVYLLDDPLHAVDATVARHLFEHCIRGPLLRNKAVILTTHQLQFLGDCDEVLLFKSGAVIERGTLAQLMSQHGEFAQLASALSKEPTATVDEAMSAQVKETPGTKSAPKLVEVGKAGTTAGSAFFQLVKAEDKSSGTVALKVYQSYAKATGGYINMVIVFTLYSASQACRMLVDWWFSVWVQADMASEPGAPPSLAYYGSIYAGIAVLFALILMIRGLWFYSSTIRASRTLHNDVFRAVLDAKMEFFDTTPVGRLINRFSSDIDQIDDQLPDTIDMTVYFGLQVLGVLFMIVASLWYLTILFIPLAWIYWWFQSFFRKAYRELKRIEGVSRSPIVAQVTTTLSGLATLRSFGAQSTFLHEHQRLLDQNHRVQYVLSCINRWLGLRLDMLTVVVIVATSAMLLFLPIDPSLAGLVLSYTLQLTNIFQWFARQLVETESKLTSVERLLFYVDSVPPEETNESPTMPAESWPSSGKLQFDRVSMRYRAELPLVLNDLSFVVKPREKIGIVGRTGAGKSSLATALFRLAEVASGDIRIDDVRIGELSLERVRAGLGIIPQEPVLFEGSVRYNLDPFGKATDDKLWRVLQQAHLHEAIKRLPEGLESPVTDHGENFSVGERQLLCLARALLREPRILLLDEATAAVDSMTDALVQKTIRECFTDCTVLIIAHRLDTVIDADKILVMHQGRVHEFDDPAVLLGEVERIDGTPSPAEPSIFAQLVSGTGPDTERFLRQQAKQHSLARRNLH